MQQQQRLLVVGDHFVYSARTKASGLQIQRQGVWLHLKISSQEAPVYQAWAQTRTPTTNPNARPHPHPHPNRRPHSELSPDHSFALIITVAHLYDLDYYGHDPSNAQRLLLKFTSFEVTIFTPRTGSTNPTLPTPPTLLDGNPHPSPDYDS